jgi:hypothetical protein
MSSQGSEPPVRKKIKCNDAGSSEAQQAQSKNADTAHSERVCMKINGKKLNINGKIISIGSNESLFLKLLFEKINTYVPTDDLYVALYGGEAGDWYKDSRKERQRFYSLLGSLHRKLPKDWFEGKASKLKSSLIEHHTGFLGISIVSAFNFLSHRWIRILRAHDRTRKHISFRRLTFKPIFGELLT